MAMTEAEIEQLKEAMAQVLGEPSNVQACPLGLTRETAETLNEIAPTMKEFTTYYNRGTATIKWFLFSSVVIGVIFLMLLGAYHQLKGLFSNQ